VAYKVLREAPPAEKKRGTAEPESTRVTEEAGYKHGKKLPTLTTQ